MNEHERSSNVQTHNDRQIAILDLCSQIMWKDTPKKSRNENMQHNNNNNKTLDRIGNDIE